jgi:hypothetical protein
MKQLVIADRAVENDKILRDRVLSTMNGYVDEFKVIRSRTVPSAGEKTIEIEADVKVSSSRIENFLGFTSGGKAAVNGGNLLADVQREKASRKARTEILLRLFDAYPTNAIQVTINSIRPDAQSPDRVHIDFAVRPREAFLKQLRVGLKELGAEVPSVEDAQRGFRNYTSFAAVCFSDLYRGESWSGEGDSGGAVQSAQTGSMGGMHSSGCTVLPGVDLPAIGKNGAGYFLDSFFLRVLYSWDVKEASVAFAPETRCPPEHDGHPLASCGMEKADTFGTDNPLFAIRGLGKDAANPRESTGVQIWIETRTRYYRITIPANAIPENARVIHILPFLGQVSRTDRGNTNVELQDSEPIMITPFGNRKVTPLGNARDSLEKELTLNKIGDK